MQMALGSVISEDELISDQNKQNPSWKLEGTFSNPALLKTDPKAVPVAPLTHSDLLSQSNSVLTVCSYSFVSSNPYTNTESTFLDCLVLSNDILS